MNVGNDYNAYVQFMHLIYYRSYVPTEVGFNILTYTVYLLSGFENYLTVFALFSFMTVLIFLSAIYRSSENFLFSFFLFMCFGYYFQSFSGVRHYFVTAIALYAIPYVLRKQWVRFALLILLAATFQKSVLVVLPFYFLASLKWRRWRVLALAAFSAALLFFQDLVVRFAIFLYPTYRDVPLPEVSINLVNIARCGGILLFSLIYYRQAIRDCFRNRFYFYCNAGAFLLYACYYYIPYVSRIAYFLSITHLFFLPAIIGRIEDKRQRYFFTGLAVVAGILYFAMYLLKADDEGVRVLPYQTFIFYEGESLGQ
jgi:hypothetical protein